MKFQNILFPVDGSSRSTATVPFVNAMARKYGASLTLINVVEIPAVWYGAAEAPVAPDYDFAHLVQHAEHQLTYFAADAFAGLDPRIYVEQGDPGQVIPDFARQNGIDLIMMPSRGRGPFRAALLGSVAAKVLHDAHCAVWTDAHTENPDYAVSPEIGHLLCAIDTIPDALPLLTATAELAARHHAETWLVHAVPAPPQAVQERYFDTDFDVFLKDTARKSIAELQKQAGTSFKLCIANGLISSVVAAAALDHRADLVVAGRGSIHAFAGGLRTHLYSIIRDVACPVLSF